jgi:hypothetical protein
LFLRGIFKIQRLFYFGSPTAQQQQTMQFLWPSASRWKILWSSGIKCTIILTVYITWLPLQRSQWARPPRQSRQWEAPRHCLVFTTVIEQIASNGNSTNLLVIKTLKNIGFINNFSYNDSLMQTMVLWQRQVVWKWKYFSDFCGYSLSISEFRAWN